MKKILLLLVWLSVFVFTWCSVDLELNCVDTIKTITEIWWCDSRWLCGVTYDDWTYWSAIRPSIWQHQRVTTCE